MSGSIARQCVIAAGASVMLDLAAARGLGAQNQSDLDHTQRVVRLIGNVVQLDNLTKGRTARVYESRAWWTRGISMSPDGHYIALIEVAAGVMDGHAYRIPPKATLVILDTTGNVVRRVDRDVQRYAWCGSSRLAFISGVYAETEMEFDPTGAGIVDISTGSLDSLPGLPREMAWAAFDSSLYLASPARPSGYRINRYEPSTGTVTATAHRGLAFSADGRFYLSFTEWQEGSPPPTVRRTSDDALVSNPDLDGIGPPVRWLPSGGSNLLVLVRKVAAAPRVAPAPGTRTRGGFMRNRPGQSREHDYVVYDVGARRAVHRLHAEVPDWGASGGAVPLVMGGRVHAITRP